MAKTVFLFGVAHKAAELGLENRIVFESFPTWLTPYGVKDISGIREELLGRLPKDTYIVSDSMQAMEHSLEALIPILLYFNKDVEFIPILVPYMNFGRMDSIAAPLAEALAGIVSEKGWKWGKDFAFLVSNDAVHYGDEDWGGRNYAPFGVDSTGYHLAVLHEEEIIDSCLIGPVTPAKLKLFTQYTVQEENYRQYKWTWCGRYSVPLGLLTAWHLKEILGSKPLEGIKVGYLTSIDHERIYVDDLEMGVTAPANLHHWVGYAAIGYK
jgi:AmmeMemoRadiSam system protein B